MERKSKKAAEDRIRQESQRLIRETAVTLPRHIPAIIDLDYFIALTADACSLKPSSIPPTSSPPQIPLESPSRLVQLSIDPVVPESEGIQSFVDGQSLADQQSSEKPSKSDVIEEKPPASVSLPNGPSLKKFDGFISFEDAESEHPAGKYAPVPAANRLLCNEVKKARQPGAKYMILRQRLQEDMLKNKQQFLELQKAQYKAEEEAIEEVLDDEEEEEEVEEKYEKKAAESSSDEEYEAEGAEEGYTSFEEKEHQIGPLAPCDSESEPDEADIVDDDYGKDEPEQEENDFLDAEAAESGNEEEVDEEEDDTVEEHSEVLKEKRRKPVNEDSNDVLKFAAHDDSFDENFLDGIGEAPLAEEASNSAPHPENAPTSDLPLTQQEDLLLMCSFAPDQSAIESPSLCNSTQLMFSSQDQPDPVSTQRENDLLNNMESSQERNELLGLLTCPPADFNIPMRQQPQSQISEDLDADDPIIRTKAPTRNRMILDDDEDAPPEMPETTNTKPKKPLTTNIMDSDSDTDEEEEEKKDNTEAATQKKRRYRPQSESEKEDDDADNEMGEGDGEGDEEEEENFHSRPQEDDEEGLANYYEFMNVRDKKGAAAKYFENEAELSDDDQYHGSGDEDEDALDVALPEDIAFVDVKNHKLSGKELRNLQQFHQQAADDEDEEQLELLRNRYLHEEDPLLANTKDIARPNYLGIDLNGIIEATSSDPPLDPDDPDAILQNNFFFIAQEIRKNANIEDESEQALLKENSFVQFYESVECREKLGDESLIIPAGSQEENPGVFPNGKKAKPLGFFGKRPREMTARFTEIVAVEEKIMAPPPVVSSISLPGKLTLAGVETSRSKILSRSISNKEPANKRLRLSHTAHNNGKSIFSLFR